MRTADRDRRNKPQNALSLKDWARFSVSVFVKTRSAKSSKAAPQPRRSLGGKKGAKGGKGKTTRKPKKRKWTKRAVRVRVVSEEGIERIVREYRRWLWREYRARNLSLEDVAAEIGATRQGFSNLLVQRDSRFFFDTFLRTCFLRREVETGLAIVVEGWKVQLRWTVERYNRGCVSSSDGRA